MSRPKYHQSHISLYLKCGLAYQYRYIDGIIAPPQAALTLGSAVDAAVTYNLVEKMKSGQDLPEEQVLDTFATDFDTRAKETEWGEDDPGEQKDNGIRLVKAHHKEIAPKIEPATVQESFVIETDAGYDLGGQIDITEKSGVIADTKTSKNAYPEGCISREFQPALYDFAYEALHGQKSTGFRYDVLIKPGKKKPEAVQQVSGTVTAEDRNWLFYTIEQVHKAITAGIAMPAAQTKGVWWCSQGWCGYAAICPKFKGRRPTPESKG